MSLMDLVQLVPLQVESESSLQQDDDYNKHQPPFVTPRTTLSTPTPRTLTGASGAEGDEQQQQGGGRMMVSNSAMECMLIHVHII